MKTPIKGEFSVSFFAPTKERGIEILEYSTDFDPGYVLQLWEIQPNKYGNAFVGIYFEEHGIPTPDSAGLANDLIFRRFIKAVRTSSFSQKQTESSK